MLDIALQKAIAVALKKAQKHGDLPAFEIPADIPVEHPKSEALGDYATPICMQLAKFARMAPIKIAPMVVKHLPRLPFLAAAEVAAPGYINFRLSTEWLTSQVEAILASQEAYGHVNLGEGRSVQVEYVSANPTGPLHIGTARNAALGDALASILAAAGYKVQREYYVNNAGSRVRAFGESAYAAYAQVLGRDEPIPEDGYHGQHMLDMGAELAREQGPRFLEMPREQAVAEIGELGLQKVVAGVRADLEMMNIRYDNWFSERTLYTDGTYERILTILRQENHLDLHDGAVWFKATELGGDKDEVVIRSNGQPGYFASDIAYHYNKFIERGFDWVIDVWGADHQGHVPRMKAMMRALGLDPERLTIILYQLVTFIRGGEIVRLSKRTGDIITLREVLEEVGPDAMRYFLLARSADSQMDFDLDLAVKQSDENPVYYIQYAHARISSILRFATQREPAGQVEGADAEGNVALLTSEPELGLIRKMVRLPEIVRVAASHLAPHHLAYYAYELAAAFHAFYRDCRVVSSDPADEAITRARLKLVSACRIILASVLHLMGMNAPEMM